MAEDEIKSNKYSKVAGGPDIITGGGGAVPARFVGRTKVTKYQPPPEERERVLDEIPGPDFEIQSRDE